MCGIFQL